MTSSALSQRSVSARRPNVNFYIAGSVGVVASTVIAWPGLRTLGVSEPDVVQFQCWVLSVVGVWCIWSWKKAVGSLLHPYVLLFCSIFAFHGSLAVLKVLGLGEFEGLEQQFPAHTVAGTLTLISICIASLHLGALAGYREKRQTACTKATATYSVGTARQIAAVLLVIAAVPTAIMLIRDTALVYSQGYFALYQAEAGIGFGAAGTVIGTLFVPAALYVVALSQGRPMWLGIVLALLLGYCAITLYGGGRSPAAIVLMSTVWLVDRRIRRVPRIALVVGAIALLTVFAVVRAVRALPGAERTSLSRLSQELKTIDRPVVQSIAELGGTARTVSHTLELVPDVRPFDCGATYARALTAIVPNVAWHLHPAVATAAPSKWLIGVLEPATAAAGGTIGFSFIAEAYLNFGWYGAPAVMLMIGLFWGKLCAWGNRGEDPLKLAVLAGLTALSLKLARNDATAAFRVLVWYSFVPYFAVHYLAGMRLRTRGGAVSLFRQRMAFRESR